MHRDFSVCVNVSVAVTPQCSRFNLSYSSHLLHSETKGLNTDTPPLLNAPPPLLSLPLNTLCPPGGDDSKQETNALKFRLGRWGGGLAGAEVTGGG